MFGRARKGSPPFYSKMKKLMPLFIWILAIPLARAGDGIDINFDMNWNSLFDFLNFPRIFGDFFNTIINSFLVLVNAPLQPLLSFIKSLLASEVQLSLFVPLWAIILYVLSLFYGILLFYAGFNFMISGYDMVKRAKAKEWLRNILIMIVLIQGSYFFYSSTLAINGRMTSGIINMIDPHFFLITADNIVNVGLELLFTVFYVASLFMAALLLTLRYIIIAGGIVFVPIGIFLYFIPPLRDYGKLILSFLGVCIFISFFDAIIFLICSKVIDIPLFSNFKILVMISAFSLANFMMLYFMLFSAIRSAFKTAETVIGPILSIAKYFA